MHYVSRVILSRLFPITCCVPLGGILLLAQLRLDMTLIADKMGFVYAVHPSLPILECSVSYFAIDE